VTQSAQILLCPPRYFDLSYVINPWMQANFGAVDPARAARQWRALRRSLADLAELHELPAIAGLPDYVFTANAGLVFGKVFVPSRFRHAERQGESEFSRAWFREQGFEIQTLPPKLIFEGAGDALFESDTTRLWMGYGPRSEAAAAPALARLLGIEVEPLQLVDPRFYHLDTCFCPLPRGGLLYFPAAFDAESRLRIQAAFPADRRIAVVEAEALRFACNAICVDNTVVADGIADATEARLGHLGLDVLRVELDEFQKSGGSAKCLTLRLDVPSRNVLHGQARPRAAQPRAASQAKAPSAAQRPLAKQAVSR
jgi:N-dimethylarginine dimethylaminohydrolase